MPTTRQIYVDPQTPAHLRSNWAALKYALENDLVSADELAAELEALQMHTFQAGENLTVNDVVYQSSAGVVSKAQADTELDVAGFATETVLSGANVLVQYGGFLSGFAGLTVDGVLFLSASTAGLATHTAPTTVGQSVIYLGRAVSATKIWIDIFPGIHL